MNIPQLLARVIGRPNRRAIDALRAENQRLRERMAQRDEHYRQQMLAACLPRLFKALHEGIELAVKQGCQAAQGLERISRAIRTAPQPRGRLGGLARARHAWRYADGTFVAEADKRQVLLELQEAYARGGRARAATARRNGDGTFAPNLHS